MGCGLSWVALPTMPAMTTTPIALPLQRRIAAVLMAWLCVMVVSGLAPWMQAQAAAAAPGQHSAAHAQVMERLCSGSGQAQWIPSPFAAAPESSLEAEHDDTSHHTLACALCLPVLALAGLPQAFLAVQQQPRQPVVQAAAQCNATVAALPPVRGPPWGLTFW